MAVRVDLDGPRWLMLLGLDGTGRWRTYLPAGGEEAVRVQADLQEPDPGYVGHADVNGDGILDAFELVTIGAGLIPEHAAYAIHAGVGQGAGFAPTPLAVLEFAPYQVPEPTGWVHEQVQFKVADFTGDGTPDVMAFVRTGV